MASEPTPPEPAEASSPDAEPLTFEPDFLRRLERLAIVARKTLRGVGRGERRSKRHGGTVEFADYRRYAPGDDTRRIDWYAYARLEQMFLKLYVEEQDLSLHILLDVSASMGHGGAETGAPETDRPSKLLFAGRLAVALAYIALAAGDRVSVRPFRGGERGPVFGPARGRGSLVRLLRFLQAEGGPAGRTTLKGAVDAFCSRSPAQGVVIVLSDLLDPAGTEAALTRLRYSGFEVHVIHVVDPAEAAPQVGEDLDLVDAETGDVVTVSLTQAAVREYRRAFDAFTAGIRALCKRHEIGYVEARTDEPFEDLILGALRASELVR